MQGKVLPRIATVSDCETPLTLRVKWRSGPECRVDLSGTIESFLLYEPLRSPELFGQARVGEHGTDVVWNEQIGVSADTLWRLALEQA